MDPDTDDGQLVYEVTAEPKHGFLESKQKPGSAVTTFTQGTEPGAEPRIALAPRRSHSAPLLNHVALAPRCSCTAPLLHCAALAPRCSCTTLLSHRAALTARRSSTISLFTTWLSHRAAITPCCSRTTPLSHRAIMAFRRSRAALAPLSHRAALAQRRSRTAAPNWKQGNIIFLVISNTRNTCAVLMEDSQYCPTVQTHLKVVSSSPFVALVHLQIVSPSRTSIRRRK